MMHVYETPPVTRDHPACCGKLPALVLDGPDMRLADA